MVSRETLDLANQYLQKHTVPEERFGLTYTIENSDWMLVGDPFMPGRSIQLTLQYSDGYYDCLSLSERLCLDISSANPELRPRIATGFKNGIHSWVQIRDPKSHEVVQIDCTPWYACLNPGHQGVEREYPPSSRSVPLTAPPFTVRKIDKGKFITVALSGSLPRCKSAEEKMRQSVGRWSGGRPVMVDDAGPVYSFLFQIQKDRGFGTEVEQFMHIFIDILDLDRLHRSLGFGRSIDVMAVNRSLNIGFAVSMPDRQLAFIPGTIGSMRQRAEKTHEADLFAEFNRSIPAILKLLSGTHPSLGIMGSSDRVLSVADGRFRKAEEFPDCKYKEFIRANKTPAPTAQPGKRMIRT